MRSLSPRRPRGGGSAVPSPAQAQRTSDALLIAAFALIIGLIALIGWVGWWVLGSTADRYDAVVDGNARLVKDSLEMKLALDDEVIGLRGFLISQGREPFLAPYHQGRRRFETEYESARRRVSGSESARPRSQALLAEVRRRHERLLPVYEREIELVRRGRNEAAAALDASSGKPLKDSVVAALDALIERQETRLYQGAADAGESASDVRRLLVGMLAAALVAALVVRRLRAAQRRVDATLEAQRRFLREASHELRTPITICSGTLQVMDDPPAPQELDETRALVLDELGRMARIVDDMTTLARSEDPEFVRLAPTPLSPLVGQVAAKAAPLLQGELSVDSDADGELAPADAQRLAQALLNLLGNAAVHGDGRDVRLRLVREPSWWRFEVSDRGGGLPAGRETEAFEPYWRAGDGRPGSGLGLAIVRAVAEAHRGSAGVDNRPGVGATFWLRIPR